MQILAIIAEAVSLLFGGVDGTPAQFARSFDEYGEELAWMGAVEMDGFAYHGDDMPSQPQHGHAETEVTFPGNEA